MEIPTFGDRDGFLSALEGDSFIPFEIERVYFIYGVPEGVIRGSHGHKTLEQVIIPVAGSFEVCLKDGVSEGIFQLDSPTKGLYVRPGLWRNLQTFSKDAVCLVLASEHFDEADYLHEYSDYLLWAGAN